MTHRIGKPQYSSKELLHAEKLSELVHRIGHEIDNPLTAVISLAAVLGRVDDQDPAQLKEKLRSYGAAISGESWRVSQLVNSLIMIFSKKAQSSEVSLKRLVKQAMARVKDREKFDRLPLSLNLPESDETIEIDGSSIQSLLVETLLLIHELATEQELAIADPQLTLTVLQSRSSLTIKGSCNLSRPLGFSLDEMFRPFALRDHQMRALGLSPAVIAAIVERLGGLVFIEETSASSDSTSTTFSIHVQISLADTRQEVSFSEPSNLTVRTPTKSINILIIDDEELVSESLRKIIELTIGSNTAVACHCTSGTDVLTLLDNGLMPNLVLCDMNLVNISGRHIYQSVVTKYPMLTSSFVFLTADPDNTDFQKFFRETKSPCIRKPFDAEMVVQLVQQLLGNASI